MDARRLCCEKARTAGRFLKGAFLVIWQGRLSLLREEPSSLSVISTRREVLLVRFQPQHFLEHLRSLVMDLDPEGLFRDDSDSESEFYQVGHSPISFSLPILWVSRNLSPCLESSCFLKSFVSLFSGKRFHERVCSLPRWCVPEDVRCRKKWCEFVFPIFKFPGMRLIGGQMIFFFFSQRFFWCYR